MKLKIAAVSAVAALAAACGGEGDYTFESGEYAVSGAKLASSSDQCGLLGAYTDPTKVIGIQVADTTVTFNLANDPTAPPASLPTATLESNILTVLKQADYEVAFGDTCVTRIRRDVVGDVTADNIADLTLSFDVDVVSGCTVNNSSFENLPCASSYQFTATKK